jgi:hypothetical protein
MLGQLGRELVEQRYSWSDKMSAFSILLGDGELSAASAGASRCQTGKSIASVGADDR